MYVYIFILCTYVGERCTYVWPMPMYVCTRYYVPMIPYTLLQKQKAARRFEMRLLSDVQLATNTLVGICVCV